MTEITADLTEGLRVEMRNGRHTWIADEPTDVPGGTDEGPTPYDLLLSSLAACTLITLRIVADREGIPLDHVSARFRHEKIHARDCEVCDDDATGWIDVIETEIFVDGDFTEEQRARLERVATKCPVHKTMENSITFSESLVVG